MLSFSILGGSKGATIVSFTDFIGSGIMGSSCAIENCTVETNSNRKRRRCLFARNVINPIFVAGWFGF
jgi:hypothetical protein